MELDSGGPAVNGSVKRAYPLQSLCSMSSGTSTMSSAGRELGAFGPGVGPCGPDASQIVVIVVENHILLMFFYDEWASKMQFIKRHYKLQISGQGLVTLEWEAGAETEERMQCIVVAERNVLKKTLDRQPRLFPFPKSLHIKVVYEEPQRLPESDQLRFLPPKTITTRDLHSVISSKDPQNNDYSPPRKKANHGKRMLEKATNPSTVYRYSCLSELVDGYADIYGVAVNMTLPKKTSGRDFCMTVSLTDESRPTRAEAIHINIFYPTIAAMPKIKYVGDIIRFHKVKIQQFQNRIQGLSLHRATRFLVLREQATGDLEQLTNSDTWTFEPSDEHRTRALIEWAKKSIAEDKSLPQGYSFAPKFLSELKYAEGFTDLVVRVLHLDDKAEPTRLIIWDGSGLAADSDRVLVQILQDEDIPVPVYGLLKEVVMSSCWSVVREMGFIDGMLTNWCRFRNLAVGIDEPLPEVAPERTITLRFREVTSFVLMPDFALDVQRRLVLNNLTAGTTSEDQNCVHSPTTNGSMKVITVIPEHIIKSIPVTPLREILRSKQTPRKYHCCAQIRSIWPTEIVKICKPKASNSSDFIYSFVLGVQEGSDYINVIVYGNDAEHFLHGIPPCDLSKNTSSSALVKKRFAALLNANNAFHLCIKSYLATLPSKESDCISRAVRYRLFDTLLRCT
ncbi:Predicted telomere binding protein [Plasmopara halstedii]|uniref:Predicted telomere binding protein n=1 Tax=Plasmopara halstedii TaxID=4781 RepID=A0A0P1AB36_PLAHL|nr:Predicted telomere binding protein [Plasmopara halstedii]CEG37968.1 Predicted telomere binding protein [Plasmopara halstedii]|eukprot:XP_024574337.1 Predicted telomere binding protein [Plasmopara halstedii]